MITHNLKNVGYLINIFISLLFTEMVVPVMLDILQILTGFRCEFNGFHRKPSRQLSLFQKRIFFPTQVHRCSSLLPVNPAGHRRRDSACFSRRRRSDSRITSLCVR